MLADEVVTQLDETNATQVMSEILHGPWALLLVTHDRALAAEMPTQYVIEGRVLVNASDAGTP